ncbi:hypothetical protein NMG60_11025932 [Bertholletia excelsa]
MKSEDSCMGCLNPCHCKDSLLDPRPNKLAASISAGGGVAPRKAYGVAAKFIQGVSNVFFFSLGLCSCMYIDTTDDSDSPNSAESLPRIRDEDHSPHESREDQTGTGTETKTEMKVEIEDLPNEVYPK